MEKTTTSGGESLFQLCSRGLFAVRQCLFLAVSLTQARQLESFDFWEGERRTTKKLREHWKPTRKPGAETKDALSSPECFFVLFPFLFDLVFFLGGSSVLLFVCSIIQPKTTNQCWFSLWNVQTDTEAFWFVGIAIQVLLFLVSFASLCSAEGPYMRTPFFDMHWHLSLNTLTSAVSDLV